MQNQNERLDALEAQVYEVQGIDAAPLGAAKTVTNLTLTVVRFKDGRGIDRQVAFNESVDCFGITAGMQSLADKGYISIA